MPARFLSNGHLSATRTSPGPGGVNWRAVAFYLLVPLAFAGYGAMNNWQLIGSVGPLWAVAFYLGHALLPWFVTCAATSLVMQLLAPWRPGRLLLMVAGHTLACIIVLPYVGWLTGYFASHWPDTGLPPGHDILEAGVFGYWLSAGAVWLAINYLFDRFLGFPRYRYDTVSRRDLGVAGPSGGDTPPGSGIRPAFLERVPVAVRLPDVIAVKAEQHYIRIVTPGKSYMVLHRFSDALCELGSESGLQIHRSWWVRGKAVQRVRQSARKMSVILQTGEEIPVSGPYQAMVRQLAKSNDLPVTALT